MKGSEKFLTLRKKNHKQKQSETDLQIQLNRWDWVLLLQSLKGSEKTEGNFSSLNCFAGEVVISKDHSFNHPQRHVSSISGYQLFSFQILLNRWKSVHLLQRQWKKCQEIFRFLPWISPFVGAERWKVDRSRAVQKRLTNFASCFCFACILAQKQKTSLKLPLKHHDLEKKEVLNK